jgi:hypothetical protein
VVFYTIFISDDAIRVVLTVTRQVSLSEHLRSRHVFVWFVFLNLWFSVG